jgi:hypothetical protein
MKITRKTFIAFENYADSIYSFKVLCLWLFVFEQFVIYGIIVNFLVDFNLKEFLIYKLMKIFFTLC